MDAEVLIVAGEASGDLHGASLVGAIRERAPRLRFFGVGGDRMAAAGVEIVEHIDRLAVMGLVEVLRHLPLMRRVLRELGRALQARRPRLVILIDYPDFNIRVTRLAHEAGVRVMYYISPQVWAWRAWRARLLARLVDRMIVVFAFEVPFYERFGLRADFVGHPLLDVVAARTSREALLERAGLRGTGLLLGLLPGSRVQEVRAMLPTMLHAAARLQARMPQLEVIIGAAPTVPDGSYHAAEADALYAPVVREMTYDVMRYSDAVIAASGTATLECAILGTPFAAVYKTSPATYAAARLLVRVPHIAMVNLVARAPVVPELVQGAATPERLAGEVAPLLCDGERRAVCQRALEGVVRCLGEPGASQRAAAIAIEMLTDGA